MCGIAGIVHLDGRPVDCTHIKRMTDAIAHRGPDGEGQWCEGSVGLGHRRLAIIDLSDAASQPMQSLDARYVITYNGEVYNFRELRRELEKSGSRFRSHSDTEVVLEAVIRWGIDSAIKRFNGMFAFAIWDRETKTLELGRDRYGIKPLYVWTTSGHIAFASEPKAFRALPRFTPVIDINGLAEYFTFQNILTDRTFLEGVKVFPAGHWARLLVSENQAALQEFQYWDFDFQEPEAAASEAEYVEELRRLLAQAVDRQLVSDVEVGAYLSGGLDSGSIVTLAAQRLPGMKTFTIGFELEDVAEGERQFDERAAAELVAAAAGATPIEMVIGARHVTRCLARLAYHLEEPRVGQSYPNYYAAQLASGFVKVVLAGTGGDEVLGGYPWRYPTSSISGSEFANWHFGVWNRLLSREELDEFLQFAQREVGDFDARAIHAAALGVLHEKSGQCHDVQRAMYFEAKTFLPGLLAVEDRLSMAHGLESRVPFLDNDLVDFCQHLPRSGGTQLTRDRDSSAVPSHDHRDGKARLRRAMASQLPPAVVAARKQGFSGPDSQWFAGQLSPSLDQAQGTIDSRVPGVMPGALRQIRKRRGDTGFRALSWSILATAAYLEEYGQ